MARQIACVHKAAQCDIVYTPFLNLKKEDRMEVGQVGSFECRNRYTEINALGPGWLQGGVFPNLDQACGQGLTLMPAKHFQKVVRRLAA